MDVILADLRQEMVDGSAVTQSGNTAIFQPSAPANAVPALAGSSGAGGLENLLKRSAHGVPFSSGSNASSRAAAVNSENDPALDHRFVSKGRWNAPLLMPAAGLNDLTPTLNGSTFTGPDWVYVTQAGTNPQTFDPSLTPTGGNGTAVIGRYAYTVYDEGGLLNLNVAGYPSVMTSAQTSRKFSLAYADLAQLPGFSSLDANTRQSLIDALVGWRNPASTQVEGTFPNYAFNGESGSNYDNYVRTNTSGYLQPSATLFNGQTDRAFTSRQQLISFLTRSLPTDPTQAAAMQTALRYLTHFNRELNAPSWFPITPTGSTIDYTAQQNDPAKANRFLPNVRVAGGFTRADGTQATPDEPLLKTRFPLSRLQSLGLAGVNTAAKVMNGGSLEPASIATVQRDFGMLWDGSNARWSYTGAIGSITQTTIKTLAQVAMENREPNFFELLKAGILAGSLGNASDFESFCANIGEDANPDYQIIQIGANIMDQADADGYPTRIAFGREMDTPPSVITARSTTNATQTTSEVKVFAGVEDLPFLQSVVATAYRRPVGQPTLASNSIDPVQDSTRDYINGWLQFVLWKPQQPSNATFAPSNFRVFYTGSDIHMIYYGSSSPPIEFPSGSGVIYGSRFTSPVLASGQSIRFTDNPASFRVPTLLGGLRSAPENDFSCSQLNGNGGGTGDAQLPRGLWLGETYRPERINTTGSPNRTAPATTFIELACAADSRFDLQYQDSAGAWRTYQRYDRFGMGSDGGFRGRGRYGLSDVPNSQSSLGNTTYPPGDYPWYRALNVAQTAFSSADARSQRFGLMGMFLDSTLPSFVPSGDWKQYLKQGWQAFSTTGTAHNSCFHPAGARFSPGWTGGTFANPFGFRTTNAPITDPTKFWADNPASGGSTYYLDPDGVRRRADGDSAHGVRPMQSNGDAGFVPATAALSVVLNRPFESVGELAYVFRDEPYKTLNLSDPNSADPALLDIFSVNEQPSVTAQKVNLNTRNAAVLQAVIAGALREEANASNTVSSAAAKTAADNFVASTGATALLNPGDVAGRLPAILPITNAPDEAIKSRREVIARALANSGQTRTWNLLIDVIAQTGELPAGATALSQFQVAAEQRHWLHVAIDRYTGEVIERNVETVPETGPSDLALATTTVTDHQPAGTFVSTISATDITPDPGNVYSLTRGSGSEDNGAFIVSGNTLRTGSVFEYLNQSSYKIRLSVVNRDGLIFEKPLSIQVLPSAYTQWKIARFGASANDPSVASDNASPAHDGIPNLMKYALGVDPFLNATLNLPVTNLEVANGVTYLTTIYRRSSSATDVAIASEWSSDLASWSTSGIVSQLLNDDGLTQQIKDSVLAVPNPKRFMRLKVTRP